jgi:hypothetical protein
VCVFITAVPIIKLFAWGEGDSGGHVLRDTTTRTSERRGWNDCPVVFFLLLLLFIIAGPNTKLCVWGEEDSGEHVL